jgi:hypothetical protein
MKQRILAFKEKALEDYKPTEQAAYINLNVDEVQMMRGIWKIKFWEELIANFPFTTSEYTIRHAPHRKYGVQQFFYSCVCIRCSGNVFTEPLPSNDRGHRRTAR